MRTNWVVGTDTMRGAKPGRVHVLEKETPGTIMRTVATADSENRAAFIVQACNAHAELVAALDCLLTVVEVDNRTKRGDYYHERKAAREALALAKAGAK